MSGQGQDVRYCAAITAAGKRCGRIVHGSQVHCYSHDPARKEDRKRAASKAGSVKTVTGELAEVKTELRKLAWDVLEGKVDTARGSVVSTILGVFLRACEQQRKERELEELAGRLEALEQAQVASPGPGGSRRWR